MVHPRGGHAVHPPGGLAVVATRALLETTSSCRSFDVWRNALLGAERAALGSSFQCRRLVSTMAFHEKRVTQRIFKEGAVFRLSADGLDRTYEVKLGTVVWSRPKSVRGGVWVHGRWSAWLGAWLFLSFSLSLFLSFSRFPILCFFVSLFLC